MNSMNRIFLFSILLYSGLSEKINKTSINEGASTSGNKKKDCRKINEGASTSYIHYPSYESVINSHRSALEFQHQQSIYAERCEIDTFVDNHINSIISQAQDNRQTQLDSRRLAESLDGFYSSLAVFLRYGSNFNPSTEYSRPLPNYEERIRYYDLNIQRDVLQTLMDACIHRHDDDYREHIQSFSRTVLEDLCDKQEASSAASSTRFLCFRFRRQNIFKKILSIFFGKKKSISQEAVLNNTIDFDGLVVNGIRIRRYNIIPLELINTFFEEWSQSFAQIMYRNECMRAYFNNFGTTSSSQDGFVEQVTDHTDISNLRETFDRLGMHGNSFYGPAVHRNPYHRHFFDNHFSSRTTETRVVYRFEYDCAPIIGDEHYEELLNLYKRLISYIATDPYKSNFLERYMSGIEIYNAMMRIFSTYKTPPMNFELWEERTLTEEELSTAFDIDSIQRLYFSLWKFWDIKKKLKKSKRSVLEEEVCSVTQVPELRWSEFIVYLMNVFLQAKISGKTVVWSNDFSSLYRHYQLDAFSNNVTGSDCVNKNFDTFLYLKLLKMKEWSECIDSKESDVTVEWCRAWRRVMLDFNLGSSATWNKLSYKNFHRDSKTLMVWLRKKIVNDGEEQVESNSDYFENFRYGHTWDTFQSFSEENLFFSETLYLTIYES